MIDEPKDREAIELEEIDRVQNKTPEDPVRGSQLGLGDFVFYSLLVGQVIVSTGFFAALATYVTVEMGLITVSVLVVLYDQPLPALPISVLVALLVTFIYSHCADPFAQLRELNQIHI